MIKKLNKAKETLLDKEKRAKYDEYLANYQDPTYESIHNTYNRTSTNKKKYSKDTRMYTKWEYFNEYLKYYNTPKSRKIVAFIEVILETIICSIFQIINYIIALIFSILGPIISIISTYIIGFLIIIIILQFIFGTNTILDTTSKIIGCILSIVFLLFINIAPNFIFNFLATTLPRYLSKLNLYLFKKCVGYKD